MEQITLYYRQGSSDKVYQASILPTGDGYVVQFSYGRRGTTLQTGIKTQRPVGYEEAKKILGKLVAEKTAKGYSPGEAGTPYQETDRASRSSGISCQLLNPVGEGELPRLIQDPGYWMQEKFDGRRLLIHKTIAGIEGINRNGLIVALPSTLAEDAEALPGSFIIDGEAVADEFMAFDLLLVNGADVRAQHYAERYLKLLNLLASAQHRFINLVPTALMPEQKAALLQQFKAANKEGVVFKRLDAPYTAGRPGSGGTQLKHKFCETASFIVGKVNGKRSVSLILLDRGQKVAVGNVTIPPNHEVPAAGDVVEVRYLYAFQGGSIYQPVYLGTRSDITESECTVAQLKYKPEPQEKEAA